jgi:small subunit ribosomal protein S6
MENYELTLVLPAKTTAAKKKSAQELIEKLVKTLKGKMLKTDDWGELKLSYKISGNESGIFLHHWLELDKQAVKDINNKLRLEEGVIRYLLVRKEKQN